MKKILIIEDDVDITQILCIALNSAYSVLVANSFSGLLKKVIDFAPDLIICDNSVGQYKAIEIIAGIRGIAFHKAAPVLLLSAHPEIKKIAEEIDASAWMMKPFQIKDLCSCIYSVLASSLHVNAENAMS